MYAVITVGSELSEYILKQCLVGPAKESMSVVSPSESMTGACTMFGSLVKFVVEMPETNTDQDASRMSVRSNAFNVMMAAQRSLEEKLFKGTILVDVQYGPRDQYFSLADSHKNAYVHLSAETAFWQHKVLSQHHVHVQLGTRDLS